MTNNELFRAGCWHELIYQDEESNKFWSIKVHKSTHIRKWGAIGTEGKSTVTSFEGAEEARKDAERLFLAKTKGGYKIKKPHLERETELIHFVERQELERFFESVYGRPFDFCIDQECTAVKPLDETYTFYVSDIVSDNEKDDINLWVNDKYYYGYLTGTLLNDCCRQKLIPDGKYIVETYS